MVNLLRSIGSETMVSIKGLPLLPFDPAPSVLAACQRLVLPVGDRIRASQTPESDIAAEKIWEKPEGEGGRGCAVTPR